METVRKPLQGVKNIIRFNWPFFAAAGAGLSGLAGALLLLQGEWAMWAGALFTLICLGVLVPLGVAFWIYDASGLYRMPWLKKVNLPPDGQILNIHSGFDETSGLIHGHFPCARLSVLDFFDPGQHTEASILRARAAYPPYPGTVIVTTSHVPVPDKSAHLVLLTFAAHEIRDDTERAAFFREAVRVLAEDGLILVTEHLRDFPNFLAWNLGVLHFHSHRTWLSTFEAAGLKIVGESRHTPFVTHFYLKPESNP